jgi:hypothetical protein
MNGEGKSRARTHAEPILYTSPKFLGMYEIRPRKQRKFFLGHGDCFREVSATHLARGHKKLKRPGRNG